MNLIGKRLDQLLEEFNELKLKPVILMGDNMMSILTRSVNNSECGRLYKGVPVVVNKVYPNKLEVVQSIGDIHG